MRQKYYILGKVFEINTIDSFEGDILHKELNLYPIADQNSETDVTVNYLDKLEERKDVLRNPSTHYHFEQGFRMEFIQSSVEFEFQEKRLKQINFSIKQGNSLRSLANKWLSYQFTSRKESIGLIFHELILIPTAFFFSDLSIVHASAIDDKGAILFGGTGGVGKTSLEINLCSRFKKSFFADDIVVVNKNGTAFPNLSYPKIYGYNLTNNTQLTSNQIVNKGIQDKMHWSIRKSIDPSIVRRRVNPEVIYHQVTNETKKLKAFFILVKDAWVKDIILEKISVDKASKHNRLILQTEYNVFFNHILWEEFNCSVASRDPAITYSDIVKNIDINLRKALDPGRTYIIKIPLIIDHLDFLEQLSSLIMNTKI